MQSMRGRASLGGAESAECEQAEAEDRKWGRVWNGGSPFQGASIENLWSVVVDKGLANGIIGLAATHHFADSLAGGDREACLRTLNALVGTDQAAGLAEEPLRPCLQKRLLRGHESLILGSRWWR